MTQTEFDKLVRELQIEGWTRHINPLDVETVDDCGCCHCESSNVYAMGLALGGKTRGGYRCFAVCNDCGIVEEF